MKLLTIKVYCFIVFALPLVVFAQEEDEGPDPPPDEVPIDNYQVYLALLGLLLAFYFIKRKGLLQKKVNL
ncbi:hypothetical protein AAEO56_05965 [Flavobacterium sp. DGU11]|uniref:Signal peptidase n=1 Tax=Flavobacterium arundinis TaxID=3139143 RepID=A0ABU9HUG9_9FLAO